MKDAVQGSISFEIITVDANQVVFQESVDQMLLATYQTYTATKEDMIHAQIKKVEALINEYQILVKIRPFINEGITKNLSQEEVLNQIKKSTDVTKKAALEIMNKYRISKLLTIDADTSELHNQIKSFQEVLKNLQKYVLEDYHGFVTK